MMQKRKKMHVMLPKQEYVIIYIYIHKKNPTLLKIRFFFSFTKKKSTLITVINAD
jgi:hypothetical protein